MLKEMFVELKPTKKDVFIGEHTDEVYQSLFMLYVFDAVVRLVRDSNVADAVGRIFLVDVAIATDNPRLRNCDWSPAIRDAARTHGVSCTVYLSPNKEELREGVWIAINNPHYRKEIPGYTIEGPNPELLPVSAKIDISQLN